MTTAAEALAVQVIQLPPAERVEVVERILDSLDEPDATLDALWAKEAAIVTAKSVRIGSLRSGCVSLCMSNTSMAPWMQVG